MKRMLFVFLTLPMFLLFNSCDTQINKYQAKNEDEKQIIALLNSYCEARNSADLKKLQSTFHDDGVYHSGGGGVFNKEKIVDTNPQDWLDNKVELFNPEIKIDGKKAQVTTLAKYAGGAAKMTHIYTLVNENDQWLIMTVK